MVLLTNTIVEDAPAFGSEGLFLPDVPAPSGSRRGRRRPFLREMFAGASEVHTALQQLDTIVLYARSCPYRSKKITKAGHLRYHYEAYVQEVALVRLRLLAYLTVIERLFKHDEHAADIKRLVTALRKSANELFSWFVSARDGHVHEARLADPRLADLSAYELIVSTGYGSATNYLREYRRAKREKIELMKGWNESIRTELDTYIAFLLPQITDQAGRLRWPPGVVGRRSASSTD